MARLPRRRLVLVAAMTSSSCAAALIIAQAELLSRILADAFVGEGPFWTLIAGAIAVVALRGGLLIWTSATAERMAASIKQQLREEVLAARNSRSLQGSVKRDGEVVVLLSRGLDALDEFLTGYLPSLIPAVVVPAAVVLWLLVTDPMSALIVGCTVPLIPIFGALAGQHTRDLTQTRWQSVERLGGQFTDVIAGLPTLQMFRRAGEYSQRIADLAGAYRVAAMRTLRVAFLSALVLELVATISVALVAVPVGLRLVDGELTLQAALVVLLLTPEAFVPPRQLGSKFHASAEGVAVATQVFAELDQVPATRAPKPRAVTAVVPSQVLIGLDAISVQYPDRDSLALYHVSLTIEAGERVAITGPSGAGKSTLLAVLLGFVEPNSGRVVLGGTDTAAMTADGWSRWRSDIGWVGQHPYLFADTVTANIALSASGPIAAQRLAAAAESARADEFVSALPDGYDTVIGESGLRLSAGQRQRVALARAFYRQPGLLILDEPTAHLDALSEQLVRDSTLELLRDRTSVFVTHRPSMLAAASRALELRHGHLVTPGRGLIGTGR